MIPFLTQVYQAIRLSFDRRYRSKTLVAASHGKGETHGDAEAKSLEILLPTLALSSSSAERLVAAADRSIAAFETGIQEDNLSKDFMVSTQASNTTATAR